MAEEVLVPAVGAPQTGWRVNRFPRGPPELKWKSIGEHLGARCVRIFDSTKVGTLWDAENEFSTVPDTMWLVASTKRLLDTGADDARDVHESKRHKNSDDTVPMAQEPSSGSGVKRSNIEAIRRADA